MSVFHSLWRIATDAPGYASTDLTGQGAELSGGRWNLPGTPMVYAATSRALACLETIVHLTPQSPLPLNRYLVQLKVPFSAWTDAQEFDPVAGVGWDAEPAGIVSLEAGTGWARSVASLLLKVPSVVVPEETNVLINPAHPAVRGIIAVKVRKWTYDTRLRPGGV